MKRILQAIHTDTVIKSSNSPKRNVVLDDCPPPINETGKDLTMRELATLAQCRSGCCKLLAPTKVGSTKMLASTYMPTAAIYLIMSNMSLFSRLIRRQ